MIDNYYEIENLSVCFTEQDIKKVFESVGRITPPVFCKGYVFRGQNIRAYAWREDR